MAVYTDIAFDDLGTVLAAYDIGPPRSFKGIAEGVENSNFLLQTERATYILTLYEKRVRADDLPFFLGLLEHLAHHGIACPLPVRTRGGAQSIMLKDHPAALLTFLDGLSLGRPRAGHCASAGAALAAVHRAGADFAPRRANSLALAGWKRLARATLPRADHVEHGLAELIASNLAVLEETWPDDLPSGIIHADLFPDNMLFLEDRVSGLIDFYFACDDFYAYDLAVMLNAWCFEPTGRFSRAKAQSLIAAYARNRPLSPRETAALPILARGAALRFLLTRLQDWLDQDPSVLVRPKDPREFAARLRFHACVNSASEYGV
ncbi:MAG TPA: homoserine kinase [Rhizomicrobium sp.]|jgi:homoserine kinase type II|nr:homoserine kinase [Rhizomicrobium sp.]